MPPGSTETTEKTDGPRVKQFSIFLPNKVGALQEVVKLLGDNHVEVLALNVQEAADAAIVRVVVSDPDQVEEILHLNNIGCSVTEFVVVELKSGAESLSGMLSALLAAEVNILGCYALITRPQGKPALALHVEDNECATAVLAGHGFRLLSQSDISR
jgi:hypothetical protein